MTIIDDFYKSDMLLRRWSLVGGFPRCVDDAIPRDHPDAESVLAANAEVRAQVEEVEAYEAALFLSAGGPPPELIVSFSLEGDLIEAQNPAFVAYTDALALVAAVTPETLALATLRATDDVTGGGDANQ